MNKADLINAIAKEAEISKKASEIALNTFMAAVTKALKKGDSVVLTGFGTFSTMKRKARTGRNPQTGAEIKIPAKTAPKFKPGKALKDSVK
ncbi:MAG: HU family DNA-binding protein [Patescibacteria group bacterium]